MIASCRLLILTRHKFLRRSKLYQSFTTDYVRNFLRAPSFHKIIRDIESALIFFSFPFFIYFSISFFLRRATTRPYHFNRDKQRLEPICHRCVGWTDKTLSPRSENLKMLHHRHRVLNNSPSPPLSLSLAKQRSLSLSPLSIINF